MAGEKNIYFLGHQTLRPKIHRNTLFEYQLLEHMWVNKLYNYVYPIQRNSTVTDRQASDPTGFFFCILSMEPYGHRF